MPEHFDITALPERPAKPRESGLTLMLDKGLSARQVEDVLDVASTYVDMVKLGWGTAAITPRLERKLSVYREANVPVYLGGTLFEVFFLRDRLDAYRKRLHALKIEHVEISDGTLDIPHEEKLECIRSFAQDFGVLSEVGSKDAEHVMAPRKWVQMIRSELDAGSWKVICEARESGTAGLYHHDGEVREGLVQEVANQINQDHLVFEAPQKPQQVWFIRQFGANVNLGNISPDEVIPLETLRVGLRSDTFHEFYRSPVPPQDLDGFDHVR